MKHKKKRTFADSLSKNFGFGAGLQSVMSSFLGINNRFYRGFRLRAKHILIVKKKSDLMDFGSSKKKDIRESILLLIRIKAYRGMRHKMKHPSRGQRTHTNGKTKKKFRYWFFINTKYWPRETDYRVESFISLKKLRFLNFRLILKLKKVRPNFPLVFSRKNHMVVLWPLYCLFRLEFVCVRLFVGEEVYFSRHEHFSVRS